MSDLNVYTTAEINALTPITGDLVLDSDLNAVKLYDGAAWKTFTTDVSPHQNRWGASFDGSSDHYLDLGSSNTYANTGSAFSISAWFKLDTFTNYPTIIQLKTNLSVSFILATSQTGYYSGVWFGSNGGLGFKGFSTNSSSVASSIATGWHNLVFTFDGVNSQSASSFTVYIDGSAVTCNTAVPIGSYANVNKIGAGDASHFRYDGSIDEVAIFNTELSAADITKIYNGTAPNGKPTDLTLAGSYDTDRTANLAGYWRMGDDSNDSATSGGSIATITDSRGNGNDAVQATASNQPTFSDLTGEPIYV